MIIEIYFSGYSESYIPAAELEDGALIPFDGIEHGERK
jgi:hypothetical protein